MPPAAVGALQADWSWARFFLTLGFLWLNAAVTAIAYDQRHSRNHYDTGRQDAGVNQFVSQPPSQEDGHHRIDKCVGRNLFGRRVP